MPTSRTGTYHISDLYAARFETAKEFGLNTIAQTLLADLAAHNRIVMDLVQSMAVVTEDTRRIYGGTNSSEMTEVDEYGRAPTVKQVQGAEVGFPLRMFQYAAGWTRKFLENATPADLAERTIYAEKAHMREINRQVQRAIFQDTNFTFTDFLVDNIDLPVKRLLNADGAVIPDGPNGETFDPDTHTHYLANDGFAQAQALTVINHVLEHGHSNFIKLAINTAQETAVRAFADFTPYLDPRISYGSATDVANKRVDYNRVDNRPIGILGAAEVWTKTWVPANYIFAWDDGDSRKPLAVRVRNMGTGMNLRLANEFDMFPLQAEHFETEFGVGVWNRSNGAVMFIDGAAWADPTFT